MKAANNDNPNNLSWHKNQSVEGRAPLPISSVCTNLSFQFYIGARVGAAQQTVALLYLLSTREAYSTRAYCVTVREVGSALAISVSSSRLSQRR